MLVIPLPKVILVKLLQKANELYPMLVTLFGIVMLVIAILPENAFAPMAKTGSPPIVDGMITAPPVPV